MTQQKNPGTALTNFTPMDLDALDAQEKAIGFGQGNSQFFQFKDGKNVVRLLPGLHGQQAFVHFFKHFVKGAEGGKAYGGACPAKMAKMPCVVCTVAARLSRGSDTDRALADDIGSRARVVANIIDRSAPDAGPQVAEFGNQIYKAIKDYMRTMGEDPTHPIDGFDLIIEKTGSGLKTEYKVNPSRKNSPLHSDARQMTEWLQDAPDLGTYTTLLDEAAQLEKLNGTIIGHLLASGGNPRAAVTRGGGGGAQNRSARVNVAAAIDVGDDNGESY